MIVLIFFPVLYKDELLYSAFARYHQYSGNENSKTTMEDLFGSTTVCATTILPSQLEKLCKRFPSPNTFSLDELIDRHTLLPYYAPFISKDRYQQVRDKMIHNNGTSLYMAIGRAASSIKNPRMLKYCIRCIEEDEKEHGEIYWHRTHQVEGVKVCPKHHDWLIESRVKYAERKNKHQFISLENGYVSNEKKQSIEDMKHLVLIAEQTFYLLNQTVDSINLEQLQKYYISKLQLKKLAATSGRIKWKDLILKFNQFYGEELLKENNSYIERNTEDTWLHKLFRKPRVTCHPLRHILVLNFLGETVQSMQYQIGDYSFLPFGSGPWLCLNKVADHYRQPSVNSCVISRDSKTKQPVGTFSCTCGFAYSRKGPDKSYDDQFKIGRIKEFGHIWDEKLQFVSQQDISLREMARLLGCDPKTVISRLSNRKVLKISPVDQSGILYKEEWTKLMDSNGGLSITGLRKLNQSLYSWLYRHERLWLQEHSPRNIKGVIKRARINWEERDQRIAEEVQLAAIDILYGKSDKLVRVTKAEVGRRIGKLPLLLNRLHKLPKTAKQLILVQETVEEFQLRRITLRAAELKNTSVVVKRWELIRAAGLRSKFIEDHLKVIDGLTVT